MGGASDSRRTARPSGVGDPAPLTVYAPTLADPAALLTAVGRYAVGDVFCAADPDVEDGAYSATVSDTVATFVVEVVQGQGFEPLPAPVGETGWRPTELTRYEISVGADGPGGQRLRYRLAASVLELTGGVLVGAQGARFDVDALIDPTWGSLW